MIQIHEVTMNKNQEILSLAVLAGEILIKNGGEIFRVEDTMMRIIESYGIKDYNVYVLSNGIFATIDEQGSHPYSLVRHVAFSNVNLERIAAVNQLSREICEFHYPPGEAIQKMKSCSTLLSEKQLLRHLASGFGCAAFTLLFGGKYLDCFFSLFIGIALQSFLYHARIRQSSRFFYTIAASALVTALSILPYALHAPVMVDKMVIGCIMPLVPGLLLTNAIRDFFNVDFLSGVIHMVDALVTALCIAVGVGAVMTCCQFFGGTLL